VAHVLKFFSLKKVVMALRRLRARCTLSSVERE
jgi:hypothetical protein